MPYKYFTSASAVTFLTPKESFLADFQANVDAEFSVAADIYTIQEEVPFSAGSYIDVDVRINSAISSETGIKLGDDYKKVIFSDLDHSTGLGYKYLFDDNYHICVNSEIKKNFASSITVKRCNNVLRWTDSNGNSLSSHCSIGYNIKRPTDGLKSSAPVTPAGFITVYTQLNDTTKAIESGQRFLFGNSRNWKAYRVYGNGVRSFLNQETEDNDSCRLLELYMGADYVNSSTDDTTNGIADTYKNDYELTLTPSSIEGVIGDTFQISANLEINDVSTTKDLLYISGDDTIATVSGSGGVVLIGDGDVNLFVYMEDNISASAVCPVVVTGSSVTPYEIRVSPANTTVLEGTTTTFSVFGYIGSNVQAEVYTFTADTNVPGANYTLTTTDNSFSVRNIDMYLAAPLIISATSGSYSKDISIDLRGAW